MKFLDFHWMKILVPRLTNDALDSGWLVENWLMFGHEEKLYVPRLGEMPEPTNISMDARQHEIGAQRSDLSAFFMTRDPCLWTPCDCENIGKSYKKF